jgi:hypothetical protein
LKSVTTRKFIDPLEAILARIQDSSAPNGWELIHQLHSFPSTDEMAFRSREKQRVRSAPSRAKRSVRFEKLDSRLAVEYEYETLTGQLVRMRVSFFDVLAVGYRELVAVDGEDYKGAREVRCVSQSNWLTDVVTAWRGAAAQGNGQYHARLHRPFKHYTVFSLDGRVDVVAASCTVV